MEERDFDEAEKWTESVREGLRWLGLHEWTILLALVLIFAGILAFVELSDEIREQGQQVSEFDRRVLLSLREADDHSDPIGSPGVEEAVRDVTALGSAVILGLLTLVSLGFLLIRGNYRMAVILLVAMIGGTALSLLLKDIFIRPRPDLVPVDVRLSSYSFPSGHAMMSTVAYLTLGTLLAEAVRSAALRIYLLAVAVILAVAVGFSRVYLGVHWPTDVLAGWAIGAVWALLLWAVARWLKANE